MTDVQWAFLAGAFEARGTVSIFTAGGGKGVRLAIDTRQPSEVLKLVFGDPRVQGSYQTSVYRYSVTERTACAELALMLVNSGLLSQQALDLLVCFRSYCTTVSAADRRYFAARLASLQAERHRAPALT
jgi:hypothetical protein